MATAQRASIRAVSSAASRVSRDVSSMVLGAEVGSGFSRFGPVSGIAKGPREGDQLPEHVQGDLLGDRRIPWLGWARRQQDAALGTGRRRGGFRAPDVRSVISAGRQVGNGPRGIHCDGAPEVFWSASLARGAYSEI